MGFFGFVKGFGKKQTEKVGQSIVQTLVAWDPESASRAELEEMEKKLDALVKEVAEARQMYKKEQEEADAIERLYNQRLQAAEILQQKLVDDPANPEVNEALNVLVGELEEMQPEIEREMAEAVEAKEFMVELEEVAKLSAEKLLTAKKTLQKAVQDMKRAKIKEERAKDKADRAARMAGLRSETDQLGTALSAMKKNADASTARAEAAGMKAKLLAPGSAETNNDLIASAMKQASGSGVTSSSIADRLAALKK